MKIGYIYISSSNLIRSKNVEIRFDIFDIFDFEDLTENLMNLHNPYSFGPISMKFSGIMRVIFLIVAYKRLIIYKSISS